jgi:hypothetical protein
MTPIVVVLYAWVLWHDLGIYRTTERMRLGGPTYQVTSYDTKLECEAGQSAAMAREEQPRVGPMTEQLPDGIKVWDPDRQYYTTLRYLCWPAAAGPALFR